MTASVTAPSLAQIQAPDKRADLVNDLRSDYQAAISRGRVKGGASGRRPPQAEVRRVAPHRLHDRGLDRCWFGALPVAPGKVAYSPVA